MYRRQGLGVGCCEFRVFGVGFRVLGQGNKMGQIMEY